MLDGTRQHGGSGGQASRHRGGAPGEPECRFQPNWSRVAGREAEEELRAKEYSLSESQRIAHVGSWSWDLATGVLTWTPETYRLYGVSPDTFVPSA